jgi:hypothetical protein
MARTQTEPPSANVERVLLVILVLLAAAIVASIVVR